MDVILRGLLLSDKKESQKKVLVQKITKSGSDPKQTSEIEKMFFLCFDTIVNTDDAFSYWACKQVYEEWAKYNSSTLEAIFTRDQLLFFLDGNFRNNDGAIWIVSATFQVLRKNPRSHFEQLGQVLEARAISYVREHPKYESLAIFCKLMSQLQQHIPKGDLTATFCISIINAVSSFEVPEDGKRIPEFLNGVSIIGGFLKHIWSNADPDCLNQCLRAIFKVISFIGDENTSSQPCVALAGIATQIPTHLIDDVTKMTVSDASIKDPNMKEALLRMVDWLNWPLTNHLDIWIIAFLKGLASVHKYTILVQVTEEKVVQVYEKMQHKVVRERAFKVLSHMLYSFQHSPEAFHKIVQDVPKMVHQLRKSREKDSIDFLIRFGELIHTLIYLHPGFPELYDPVLVALEGLPAPTVEQMKVRLVQSKWTSEQKPGTSLLYRSTFGKKSETGKVGLVNLGNTCFMNSIVQALYMCDSFRQDAMRSLPSVPKQMLLAKLQLLFAHLSLSQRPAYSPQDFLNISLPAWFTSGRQQDCSEYLKFLLDQMHEQEKARFRNQAMLSHTAKTGTLPRSGSIHVQNEAQEQEQETLIQKTFGGRAMTTYKCLKCHSSSSRTEMFTDLPLAFHDHNPEPRMATRQSERKSQKNTETGNNGAQSSSVEKPMEVERVLSLEEMLHNYVKPERLEGSNKYHCDACGSLQDGERTVKIMESPEYLIITLLRFSFSIKTQRRSKILTDVKYPRTLYLPVCPSVDKTKRLRATRSPPQTSGLTHERFGLCAVVMHSGLSSDCGHYYCYARHSIPVESHERSPSSGREKVPEDYFQSKWYLFNDNRVSYSTYESFSEVTQRFSKDTAYVLVYRKLHDSELNSSTVDMNETIMSVNIDPPLRRDLRESVEMDNRRFLKEQEDEGRARETQQRSVQMNSWFNWRDDDSDGPPGSCGGGGGLGGMDTSGSRFVF